jgi:hypothetical protein
VAQARKQLALQKAISTHRQAASSIVDLMDAFADGPYAELLMRIDENITLLLAELERARQPGSG